MTSFRGALSYVREAITLDGGPAAISALVEGYLIQEVGEVDATELGASWAKRVESALQREYVEFTAAGEDGWFAYNSSSPNYIQGPCYSEPQDAEHIRQAKASRLRMVPIRAALEHLDTSEFETVCGAALYLLGAREYRVTKRSHDQGIDFYGYIILGDIEGSISPFFKFTDNMRLWIVGQAKHYVGGKVSTPEVRNLVGSLNLARYKEYASSTSLSQGLNLRSGDPAFALFLTTGTYTRDASHLARASGVLLKDIDDLAKLIADRSGEDFASGSVGLTEWATQIMLSKPSSSLSD